MPGKRLTFPFSAIVGLDKLRLAILINAINPKIGGILIRGPKGSGKSTIVRSLADILPKIKVVKDCPFNCSPDDPSDMCPACTEKYKKGGKLPVEEKEMAVVDLPLGATEDRVVGSLDVEKAIKLGIKALEPGVLAAANQNILYVDEVNLLPDHIADDLLDSAATGWNTVEREGISVSHPSRFVFIGTMNPEEGELRPQLLDRFALSVNVETIASVKDRVEVVKKNMEFEASPEGFYEKHRPLQEELRNRIVQARRILNDVAISDEMMEGISKACVDLKVDGLRPDIVIAKAARTLAAFENRKEATSEDVLVAAELALSHRTREGGFLEPAAPQEIKGAFMAAVKKVFEFEKTGEATKKEGEKKKGFLRDRAIFWVKKDATKEEEKKTEKDGSLDKTKWQMQRASLFVNRLFGGLVFGIGKRLSKSPKKGHSVEAIQVGSNKLRGETSEERVEEKKGELKGIPTVGAAAGASEVTMGIPIMAGSGTKVVSPSRFFLSMGRIRTRYRGVYAGKRAQAITTLQKGKPYGWRIPQGRPADVHLPATIRQAAGKQAFRDRPSETALRICLEDVREKLRSYKAPLTMIFLVDLSGSMFFSLESVKDALLKLHSDAYRSRDRVGIVALKGLGAVVVQHPIANLRVVAKELADLHISGFTPLATGMLKSREVLKEARRRDPSTIPVMVIVTDGNANVPLKRSLETGQIREIEEVRVIVREYEDLAVRDVMSVSKMIKREGIHTVVVNTNRHLFGYETYGLAVTKVIASLSGGTHHAIGTLATPESLTENMIERVRKDQRRIVFERGLGQGRRAS